MISRFFSLERIAVNYTSYFPLKSRLVYICSYTLIEADDVMARYQATVGLPSRMLPCDGRAAGQFRKPLGLGTNMEMILESSTCKKLKLQY